MNKVTKRSKEVSYFRSPRLERAQHINEMQSRTFNNQMKIMERNIKKKLKVIENEKHHMTTYLHFLRSSSGTSPFSLAPDGKIDTPRTRPATARIQRLKFGSDGNANHMYMSSDPCYGWTSSYYLTEDEQNNRRAKSASISRSRMTSYKTTMSRIQKVETPLRKRVSWIDGGKGGDDGIRGFLSGYRNFSAKGSLTKPTTANSGTQYELNVDIQDNDIIRDEIESVTSSTNSTRKSANKTKRESVAIHPINVTFPFPVTPDKFRSNLNPVQRGKSANQFLSYDHRRSLTNSLTSITPRRKSRQYD